MKRFEFDKDNLNDLYGLSCVENFLLYILKMERYSYKFLFYKSFLSFSAIVNAFYIDKVEYAYFNKISRIQDLARKNKVINMRENFILDLDFFDRYDYICVMVKPEYIKSKYNTEMWRDDHYILLSKTDNKNFNYLNDNPRNIGVISFSELENISTGRVLAFDLKKDINDEIKKVFFNEFIIDFNADALTDLNINITDFTMARDILGIHRILRRRTCDFCSQYANIEFLTPYLNALDKHYTSLEYMRLRNKVDYNKINEIFANILQEDRNEMFKIKTELEKLT